MITEEIKIHDEPIATYYHSNTFQSSYGKEEKERWKSLCENQLEQAKKLLKIGDTLNSKNNPKNVLQIIEFIENTEDMQRFSNMPCVVRAKSISQTNGVPIQYSLPELNFDTLQSMQIEENSND